MAGVILPDPPSSGIPAAGVPVPAVAAASVER